MSAPIKKSDIAQDGILSSIGDEAKKALVDVKKFDEGLRSIAKTMKTDLSTIKETVEDIQKLNNLHKNAGKVLKDRQTSQKTLNAVEKEQLKIQQALEKAQAQKAVANSKENKQLQQLRAEKNKINKATRDEIKQTERSKNAYSRLVDETRDYKNESKRLGAELLRLKQSGTASRKEMDKLEREYDQSTNKARKYDAQLKKLDKTVGDNFRNVGNYSSATRKLTSALGSLGVVVGVGAIFRNVGGIIANFDQAVTDLAAISGKTAEELKPLNEQARELGATTQFSASEVTGLQIELAKLGFTTKEIMDSTGGIANFAAATGVEIPRAAALAGSSLRAFGLDATEIDRVVSTLGVATTKTALDFSKLENGLSTVAPVAKAFGFSIEDTTALLGQLANSGFDASSAATATRNILLNLADSGGSLAKELGRPIKSADDLSGALAELQERGIDLGEALELTDKRSVAAFQTFLDGSDALVPLRDSITDVNDELTDMAEKRLESVGGAMKLLSSAWEGFILDLNDGIGASDAFQVSIRFLAENLTSIISIIGKLVVGFLAYKGALIAINIQQNIADKGAGKLIKQFFTLGNRAKGAATETSKMGKALKGIGWAALIAFAVDLGMALFDVATGASRARKEAELLERANQRIGGANLQTINAVNAALDKQLANIEALRKAETISAKEAEQRKKDAISNAKEVLQAEQDANKRREKMLEERVRVLRETTEKINKQQTGIPLSNRAISDLLNQYDGLIDSGEDVFDVLSKTEAELKALKSTTEALEGEQGRLNGKITQAESDLTDYNSTLGGTTEATERLTGAREWANEVDKEYLSNLDEIIRKARERREEEQRIERGDFDVDIGEAPVLPEDEVDKVEDQQNELYDIINTAQENITKAYSDHVDRRIELANKEIESQRELRDILKAQAAEGNIEAEDSIKETIRLEREKEAEILRLEKRKQQVQLISQGLQTYLNLLEGGEKPAAALAQTAITSQGLISLLSGLQGFWTGTENAPEGFAWTQEKGAEMITDKEGNIKSLGTKGGAKLTYLEKGDKVKNASDTASLLNSFDNLKNAQTLPKNDVAGNSYDLMTLGSKLDRIERAIKTQPQSNSDFQTITKGLAAFTKSENRGGDKTISKYYLKR